MIIIIIDRKSERNWTWQAKCINILKFQYNSYNLYKKYFQWKTKAAAQFGFVILFLFLSSSNRWKKSVQLNKTRNLIPENCFIYIYKGKKRAKLAANVDLPIRIIINFNFFSKWLNQHVSWSRNWNRFLSMWVLKPFSLRDLFLIPLETYQIILSLITITSISSCENQQTFQSNVYVFIDNKAFF